MPHLGFTMLNSTRFLSGIEFRVYHPSSRARVWKASLTWAGFIPIATRNLLPRMKMLGMPRYPSSEWQVHPVSSIESWCLPHNLPSFMVLYGCWSPVAIFVFEVHHLLPMLWVSTSNESKIYHTRLLVFQLSWISPYFHFTCNFLFSNASSIL